MDWTSIVKDASAKTAIPSKKESLEIEPEMKIRIMLVDDHKIVRQGVADLIRREPDFEVAGEASDGESAVSLAREIHPDVVLMDVNMPRMDGIEATRIIHHEFADVKIIGFSIHDEEAYREPMLKAGAVDYLAKRGNSRELIRTIRNWA